MDCRIISDSDSTIINGTKESPYSNNYPCTGTVKSITEMDNDNNNKGNCVTKESYLSRLNGSDYDLTKILIPAGDTESLNHQIAGHERTGVLKHRLGFVLKQKQKHPLGEREVSFYQTLNDDSLPSTPERILLRHLIPQFFGVTNIENVNKGETATCSEYLVLEDIAQGFVEPCIVDVKIGVKTWDPLASEKKIAHEKTKYIGTKIPLGISITGMQYFDVVDNRNIKLDKEFGKYLKTENIHQAFRDFLNEKTGVHRWIAVKLLEKLNQVKKFFDIQKDYGFYASSLLIVYDANYIAKLFKNSTNNMEKMGQGESTTTTETLLLNVDDWLRVKMIDFAHVFSSPDERVLDENYIFGLENLIKIISTIANE